MRRAVSPARLFHVVALAEAVTWALLLAGMFLKYVARTTELGVQVFGMLHGVVFVAYVVAAAVVAVDARWSIGRTALALLAAVPPFVTIAFDLVLRRRDPLAPAWRLRSEMPAGVRERVVAWLVRHPGRGAVAGVGAVAVLTAAALVVGPPGA